MKRVLGVLIIAVLLTILNGCSNAKEKENYFYSGKSDTWLATYTLSAIDSSYYDSLTIQYLFDENGDGEMEKVGPIEYHLTCNSMEIESTYPQELQGIGNFHVGSRMNAEVVDVSFEKEIELIVKWQDKNVTIKLTRQN